MDKHSAIKYWSYQLLQASEKADKYQKVWHDKHNLDYTEQYMIMQTLLDFQTYSSLLRDDLALPEPKRSFWKRLIDK